MVEDDAPPSVPRPKTVPPPVLGPNPTPGEVVIYLRALAVYTEAVAWAARTHTAELEGIRQTMQAHGMRIEGFCSRIDGFCMRIEKAIANVLEMGQARDTLPPDSRRT